MGEQRITAIFTCKRNKNILPPGGRLSKNRPVGDILMVGTAENHSKPSPFPLKRSAL